MADIYTIESSKSQAQSAANHWNGANGKFTYDFTDSRGNLVQYKIQFVVKVDATFKTVDEAELRAKNDPTGNSLIFSPGTSLMLKKGVPSQYTGQTGTDGLMTVNELGPPGKSMDAGTPAHEIGHIFGLGHSLFGIMRTVGDGRVGLAPIVKENILGILYLAQISKTAILELKPSETNQYAIQTETKGCGVQPTGFENGTVSNVTPSSVPANVPANYPRTETPEGGF